MKQNMKNTTIGAIDYNKNSKMLINLPSLMIVSFSKKYFMASPPQESINKTLIGYNDKFWIIFDGYKLAMGHTITHYEMNLCTPVTLAICKTRMPPCVNILNRCLAFRLYISLNQLALTWKFWPKYSLFRVNNALTKNWSVGLTYIGSMKPNIHFPI